jgi:hypothetical protein
MRTTITSVDVVIALIVENKIALFNSTPHRLRSGMSLLRCALDGSSSPIAFKTCDRATVRYMRAIGTD